MKKNTLVKALDNNNATVYGKIQYNKEGIKGMCLMLNSGFCIKIKKIEKCL